MFFKHNVTITSHFTVRHRLKLKVVKKNSYYYNISVETKFARKIPGKIFPRGFTFNVGIIFLSYLVVPRTRFSTGGS